MRRILTILGLSLVAPAFAQNVLQDPHQPFPYLPLQHRVGGTWLAVWNPATDTPRMIYGSGLALADWRVNTLDEARRHANRALAEYGDILGLGSSEFRESIGARMGRTWSFKFDQHFRGLPVIGGRADVRIHMNGTLSMLGSTAFPVPDGFEIVPGIAGELATALAWTALRAEPQAGQPAAKPRLVIWGDVAAPRTTPFFLAWEVPIDNLDANDQGLLGRSYVDAKTGVVLRYESDRHDCGLGVCSLRRGHSRSAAAGPAPAPRTAAAVAAAPLAMPVPTTVTVMGYTRTGLSAVSPLVNIPIQNLVVSVPGIGTRTTDANGEFSIDIAAPVTISVTTLDAVHHSPIAGGSAPSAAVVVNPGVPATLQLLSAAATQEQAAHTSVVHWVDKVNIWARTILGNTAQLNAIDSIAPNVNVASTCNASYGGNQINFYAQGGGCNNTAFSTVIVHEWGHGLDNNYGGISNATGDGLSEGWGDIIGMYLVDDPIVGRDFRTNGGFVRNGNNTRTWPLPGGEVHAAGEIWMGFAWRLRDGLRAALGNTTAIAISNDIVISSIVADATNQPDAVTQVFIADDDDGNLLNGTPHYPQLQSAAVAKNLPYPQILTGTVTHTPLANSTEVYVPRRVVATLTPAFGSFSGMRLHFNTGAGAVVRNMFPTGAANEYQAVLPGLQLGSTVNYHFEAPHSGGSTLRFPANGELRYQMNGDVQLYAQDFESGAPGWTHAMVATQDDWHIGDPAGLSGTGWVDPQTAAGGVSVYGNDLGNTINGQAYNGAYQNNVNNYLLSPVINCSGRTNVRLRFKRWLTVQASPNDNATISVNSVPVWTNPSTGNLVDTSWQAVDLAIPQADNNPAVRIEWRLVTNASTVFGGWNIDDVEVVAAGPTPPALVTIMRLQPEQSAVGSPLSLVVTTPPSKPLLVAFAFSPGPTLLPGIPPLQVGGELLTIFAISNAFGVHTQTFPSPPSAPATGFYLYGHTLSFDLADNIVASNPWFNYFTPTP